MGSEEGEKPQSSCLVPAHRMPSLFGSHRSIRFPCKERPWGGSGLNGNPRTARCRKGENNTPDGE